MNLRQIEALIWVARLGGFAAAAERVNSTQPAISLRIRDLERELGVQLFDRSKRKIRPTAQGRSCIEYAERVLDAVDQFREHVGKRSLAGRAHVGVAESIAMTWMPLLIERLAEEHPDLELDIAIDITGPLRRGFDTDQYDVVLIGDAGIPGPWPAVYLGSLEFAWMASPDHALVQTRATPAELRSCTLLSLPRNAAIYDVIDEWFRKGGAQTPKRTLCNSMMSLATLIMGGRGISLLPTQVFGRDIAEGRLAVIETDPSPPPMHFQALYEPSRSSHVGEVIAKAAAAVSDFPGHPGSHAETGMRFCGS